MAEYVFRDLAQKSGRGEEFLVASTAVSTEEIWGGVGNPVYPPVQKLLNGLGISCEGKRAVQLTEQDGETYDYICCMDSASVRRAKQRVGGRYATKVFRLLDFVGLDGDVADPWYTRDFQATYRDIAVSTEKLLQLL